jgi:hypothetical protein
MLVCKKKSGTNFAIVLKFESNAKISLAETPTQKSMIIYEYYLNFLCLLNQIIHWSVFRYRNFRQTTLHINPTSLVLKINIYTHTHALAS